jgi:hypothetical protein
MADRREHFVPERGSRLDHAPSNEGHMGSSSFGSMTPATIGFVTPQDMETGRVGFSRVGGWSSLG